MKTKKGFTLIELLIVIAIIGILAAALLPTILNAPARGRDAARLGNMNAIVAAIEAFNSDFGQYPQGTGCIDGSTVFVDPSDGTTVVSQNYFPGGNPPQDPSGTRTSITDVGGCPAAGQYYYEYIGTVGVAEYILATAMELEQNNNMATDPAANTPDPSCTGTGCDYFVLVK